MHELSIANSLVEAAERAAIDAGAVRVSAVYLRLGVFSGVVKDALLFCYDIATEGTLLAGSQLIVEDVPLVVYCPTCDTDVTLDDVQLFICPHCGTPSTDIRQGKELMIDSMEIIDDETETVDHPAGCAE